MKYFKANPDIQSAFDNAFTNDLYRIVHEMINIESGKTYFENGQLLDEPKNGHNIYESEDYIQEFNGCAGFINLLFDPAMVISKQRLEDKIKEIHEDLFDEIYQKHGSYPVSPLASVGTTQNVLICDNTRAVFKVGIYLFDSITARAPKSYHPHNMVWFIYLGEGNKLSIHIPNTFYQEPTKSLSCIIYDQNNVYGLADGYRNMEYPSITDYTVCQNNRLYQEPIWLSNEVCIDIDLMKNSLTQKGFAKYLGLDKPHKSYDSFVKTKYDSEFIKLIKWKYVMPRKLSNITQLLLPLDSLSYHLPINSKKYLEIIKEGNNVDESIKQTVGQTVGQTVNPTTKSTKGNAKKPATKPAPKRRTIKAKLISETTTESDTIIKNDTPPKDILSRSNVSIDLTENKTPLENTSATITSAPNISAPNISAPNTSAPNADMPDTSDNPDDEEEPIIDYRCSFTNTPIYEDCYILDVYQHKVYMQINPNEIQAGDKVVTTLEYQTAVKNILSTEYPNEYESDPINIIRSATPHVIDIERKYKNKNTQKIIVQRMVKYDKPVHLLVTPIVVHWNNIRHYSFHHTYTHNKFVTICQTFQFDAILYRSYYHRKVVDVINGLNKSPLYKEILLAIKDNSQASGQTYNKTYKSKFNNKKYIGTTCSVWPIPFTKVDDEVYYQYKSMSSASIY